MPELPDIEICRRYADATSLHKTIAHARGKDEYLLDEDTSGQKIAQALVGNQFDAASRHGKVLGLRTKDAGCLVLHFAMTGNLYSDEILFQSRIAPDRETRELADEEVDNVFRAMRHVLQTSIDRRAKPKSLPENWLDHHREDGADCPNCSAKIRRATAGGRSSYACEEYQK